MAPLLFSHPLTLIFVAGAFAMAQLASGATLETPPYTCPERGTAERAEDCPWAGIARAMLDASEHQTPAELSRLFETLVPRVASQIKADARRPDLLELWGRSINFDEGAKGQIVAPAILRTIAESIGVAYSENREHVVHAGMEHTYGYLFSNLQTPYGYKRARWVQGEIERGFGLTPGVLGPEPKSGTLLLNLTSFIGRISFRDDNIELRTVMHASRDAAHEVRIFDFARIAPTRLEERVEVPSPAGRPRIVKIRTDLIPFFRRPSNPKANSYLLIYSIDDPLLGGARLISSFPVQEEFVRRVLKSNSPEKTQVSSRYNAYVDGLTGRSLPGTRKVIEPKRAAP